MKGNAPQKVAFPCLLCYFQKVLHTSKQRFFLYEQNCATVHGALFCEYQVYFFVYQFFIVLTNTKIKGIREKH